MSESGVSSYAPPLGPRYSQLYLERGPAVGDSKRLRNRLGAWVEQELYNRIGCVTEAIERRIGTEKRLDARVYAVRQYLKDCSGGDFLDAVTVIYDALRVATRGDHYATDKTLPFEWRAFCQSAFVEENVAYRVDDECIVRPFVDNEFSENASTLVRGLNDPRLAAVRIEVERSIERLGGRNPDPKAAVRAIFEAIEIYAKLAVTSCNVARLNRNIVTEHMVRAVLARPEYKHPADKAATHLGEAVVSWIDACHVYRHGQGVNDPSPPPPELAVALVSEGVTHLRWFLDTLPLPTE